MMAAMTASTPVSEVRFNGARPEKMQLKLLGA